MDSYYYFAISSATIYIILLAVFSSSSNRSGLPRNWPLFGTLPALLANCHCLLEWATIVTERQGGTFQLKGSWLFPYEMLLTVDPNNVKYTSSTKFANFPRGVKSKEVFDIFGDGLFNAKSDEWNIHRKIIRAFFNHKQFGDISAMIALDKVEKGLIPVLENMANKGCSCTDVCGTVIDLQEVFQRYSYDLTHRIVIGSDPNSLSLQWPEIPYSSAMNDAMEAIFFRHLLPESIWKMQKLFALGREKSLSKARQVLNSFLARSLSEKRKEIGSRENIDNNFDLLTAYMIDGDRGIRTGECDRVDLNGSIHSLLLAGTDTTSSALTWFFWVLSQSASILLKIKEELKNNIPEEKVNKMHIFSQEELSKMVYLHATLCETLRLYPPIPFQTRCPIKPDILPTGHSVIPQKTMIIIPLYIMGRMTSVWGKDCAEFKPERWITENGEIKHEPSHKFFTFNSGPRICLGRELAFLQMKAVAAAIIHNYDLHILHAEDAKPINSVILHMKGGLHARLTRRWA
ncbi:hypothetical protein Drorol1_Dr00011897 [Drosera rotundifolia]